MEQQNLETERLILRRYTLEDAPALQTAINHSEIANMTENIPHPYSLAMAYDWLNRLNTAWENNERYVYAVTLKGNNQLLGTVSLTQIENDKANLGYWIGADYWNKGYCSEAVTAVINFVFKQTSIPMIYARHLKVNPASGAVILNNGFSYIRDEERISKGVPHLYSYYELHKPE
jgi:RimJ/RimL family protein N-acetyltransferase